MFLCVWSIYRLELLLGERNYGPSIDMWGAGCIMAEMWTRSPIMQGKNEQQQLVLISQLCGSLTSDVRRINYYYYLLLLLLNEYFIQNSHFRCGPVFKIWNTIQKLNYQLAISER